MKFIWTCFFVLFLPISSFLQPVNDNCINATNLCAGQSVISNNFLATSSICAGCEDGAVQTGNFCFELNNSVWFAFTTNDLGGAVTATISNLNCSSDTLPSANNELQAVIVSASIPCDESTYEQVSNCISAPVFIVLTVEDCDCPELDVLVPGDLCNSAAFLQLNDLIIDNTVVVDWNIISEPGTAGYAAASLIGSGLDLTNSAPGVYQLGLEFAGSAPLGCVLTNSLQVQLSDQLEAGISLGILEFCFESGEQVALDELLQGSDLGGIWTEESVVSSTGNAFSAIAGTFDVQTQNVGLYNFRYSVDSEDPCLDNATDVFVRVNANPIIE